VQSCDGIPEQLPAAREVEAVVAVAAVERALPYEHEVGLAQLAKVVRDERLRLLDRPGQLAYATVAARELTEQSPPQRVRRQSKHGGRLGLERDRVSHNLDIHQIVFMKPLWDLDGTLTAVQSDIERREQHA
jgi:hypothetical protein